MNKQILKIKVEKHVREFRRRTLKGYGDEKRRDRAQSDEKEWMCIAHNQLGWSYAKISSVFDRDVRTIRNAVRSYKREEHIDSQTNLQDPIIIEAMRKHYLDLKRVIQEWQDEIGSGLELSNKWYPVVFADEYATTNSDMSDSVRIQGNRKKVTIRFPVENEVLFECLRIHLPNEKLWHAFEELKLLLSELNKKTASPKEKSTLVNQTTDIALTIYQELELVLVKHVYPGRCRACPELVSSLISEQNTGYS